MKTVKQMAFRIFFALEIIIFTSVYIFGPQGIYVLRAMHQENSVLEKTIEGLHLEIKELEDQIVAWKTYPFYKEKIAREQLQMARKDDQVYYLI